MIKSIRNFLIIFFIFQQLQSQISQFDKNLLIGFCEQILHIIHIAHNNQKDSLCALHKFHTTTLKRDMF